MNDVEVTAVPEIVADTTRICEIRFDCVVKMHDMGFRKYTDSFGRTYESKTPQWFAARRTLTLDAIQSMDEHSLGSIVKQMYYELENTVRQYERV